TSDRRPEKVVHRDRSQGSGRSGTERKSRVCCDCRTSYVFSGLSPSKITNPQVRSCVPDRGRVLCSSPISYLKRGFCKSAHEWRLLARISAVLQEPLEVVHGKPGCTGLASPRGGAAK